MLLYSSEVPEPPPLLKPRFHVHPGYIAAVSLGGAFGTGLRFAGEALIDSTGGWPLATLLINLVGAFGLAVFMGFLLDMGELSRRQHALRVSIGTGVLGGFTTYSSLAMETTTLLHDGPFPVALAYPLVSMVAGVLASLTGLRIVGLFNARRRS